MVVADMGLLQVDGVEEWSIQDGFKMGQRILERVKAGQGVPSLSGPA